MLLPDEFEELVTRHDFEIVGRWGGYKGELYGDGPELLIEFKHRTGSCGHFGNLEDSMSLQGKEWPLN